MDGSNSGFNWSSNGAIPGDPPSSLRSSKCGSGMVQTPLPEFGFVPLGERGIKGKGMVSTYMVKVEGLLAGVCRTGSGCSMPVGHFSFGVVQSGESTDMRAHVHACLYLHSCTL
eukprot:485959-Pelagomonas_calceolata.AAC.1